MDISIGIPDHISGIDVPTLVEWGRRAEAAGFSAVVASDRLAWSTPEPLTVLAGIAGATSRIGLVSGVLVAPLRTNHALLASSIATLDQLAGRGRLRVGMAPGLREDDFAVSGLDFHERGARLDALVRRLREIWSGETGVGPRPLSPEGPPLLFGGASRFTARRIVEFGGGWIAGGLPLDRFTSFADELRTAWTRAARPGAPRVIDTVNVALGPDAEAIVTASIGSYYGFIGPDFVRALIGSALTSPALVRAAVDAHERAGCDELVLVGNAGDPAQVDLLAETVKDHLKGGTA